MSLESLLITLEAIDNASAPIQKVAESIEQLEKQGKTLKDVGSKLTDVGKTMTTRVTAPIVAGLGASAYAAIQFETSMAEVQKAANLDDAALAAMGDELLQMSRTIPRNVNELAEMAAAGGRLGIAKDDLSEFVELTSEMSVAFDMASADAGQAAAEIANNFGMMNTATGEMDFARLETYGNTVNNLADNMATTESNIVNFTKRASGVGKTFGIMENDIAAFAAGFTALGIAPEKASNAFNTTAQRLAMATELGGKADEGFRQLGLSAADMEAQFKAGNGTEAMMQFLQAAADGGPEAAGALNKILGAGFADEILQASGGMEQFTKAFGLSAEAVAGGGSTMSDSFEIMSQTTAAQFQLMKNAVMEIGIRLGSALLPAINSVLQAAIPMAQAFADFAQANPGIVKIGLAIAAVAAAIGPLLIVIGQVVSAIRAIKTAMAGAKLAMMAFSGPIVGALSAAKAALMGLVTGAAGLAAILMGVVFAVFRIGAAFMGQTFTVQEFFAVIKNALMTLPQNLAQIPATIGAMFGALRAIIVNQIMGIRLAFMQMTLGIQMAFQQLPAMIGGIFSQIGSIITAQIVSVASRFQLLVARIQAAFQQARAAAVAGIQGIVAAISAGAGQAVAAVAAMGAQIISQITSIAGQAMAAGRQIVTSIAQGIMSGIGAVQSAAASVASAVRSALPGSPVKEGPLTVLNNISSNPGAEIVNMLARGMQSAAPALQQALGGVGMGGLGALPGGGGVPVRSPGIAGGGAAPAITINISGVGNADDAQGVADVFEERVRRVLSDVQRNEARVAYS